MKNSTKKDQEVEESTEIIDVRRWLDKMLSAISVRVIKNGLPPVAFCVVCWDPTDLLEPYKFTPGVVGDKDGPIPLGDAVVLDQSMKDFAAHVQRLFDGDPPSNEQLS